MTRLLHVSDLHFGCTHARMLAPLAEALRGAGGDLLIVSGDLTQRARRSQFRAAEGFLAGLGLPLLRVPGNHDVPLFNLAARLFWPFRGYRRHAAPVLTPHLQLPGGVRVVSLNTADPGRWRRGLLRPREVLAALSHLEEGPVGTVGTVAAPGSAAPDSAGAGILVCHHPLVTPPGFEPGETRGPVEAVLRDCAAHGVRIVLSGHLHHWNIGPGIGEGSPQPIFHLQSGTALCAREGEVGHGFAQLDLEGDRLEVRRHLWVEGRRAFLPEAALGYRFAGGGWQPL